MGWSCNASAGFTLDNVSRLFYNGSNFRPNGDMYEVGREQADGAIVGTVFVSAGKAPCRYHDANNFSQGRCMQCGSTDPQTPGQMGMVRKTGSFRIAPDGTIVRWGGLSKAQKAQAESASAAEYQAHYGGR